MPSFEGRPFAIPLSRVLSLAVAALAMPLSQGAAQAAAPLAAPDPVAEAVEVARVWLDGERAYDRIPGVSAAIVHDQDIVWSGGFGEADPEQGVPATAQTLYGICSISKLFTSIAVMQLRDRGLLDLSDPVSEHLPWFTIQQAFPDDPPVTIEGLLTHSAGLPRESDHAYWTPPDFPFPTSHEVREGIPGQRTVYPAWRHFQYSNLGISLAGEIVAARTGREYGDYVQTEILDPLGLHDTHPEMPEAEIGGRLAVGYGALDREGERARQPFYQARGIAPAAGFASTAEDLARFAEWQFRLAGNRTEVLSAHTLHEMQRVHFVDSDWETHWGLGFEVWHRDGTTFVGHGGHCPGYRTVLMLDPESRIAVAFLSNASGFDTGKFVNGVYDLVAPALKAAAGQVGDSAEVARASANGASLRATGTTLASSGPASGQAPDLSDYLGSYSVQPWGGEMAAVRWKGGLAFVDLPSSAPLDALTKLEWIEGDTFRRVREDGDPGEEIRFERDASGAVIGVRWWANLWPRIRP